MKMIGGEEKSGIYAALMFLVWPFLALVSAFRNYKSSWGKNILWAFVAFYGFSFAIGAGNQGSDIVRYVAHVEYLHHVEMTFSGFIDYFQHRGDIDILNPFITVILSRFTDSQAVLTLIYGIIFGFFFSRNIWYVLERLKGKIQPVTVLLLICFFLVVPIWSINGFRMWTAAHVFIYGLLPFLFDGQKKGLFICMAAILVHFSFIVPVGILFGYLLLGNRLVLYFCFFAITVFISEINLEAFNNLVENYVPEIIQEKTSDYRSETLVEAHREEGGSSKNWYAVWYGSALRWSVVGFLGVLFFKGKKFFQNNEKWLRLFCFTLLFSGVANLLSSLPSGGRFLSIAQLSAMALIILYIQNKEQGVVMKRFVWLAAPALMLFIIVTIRTGLYSISATAILGNPVIALFLTGEHVSLNDVLKMIL